MAVKEMEEKYLREVLYRYVHDNEFNISDVADTLDMCRSGAINVIKNLAVEALRVNGFKV